MYIEETGAGDGDLKVSVAGEEYTAEANYDLDGDGVDDTATVLTDDGHVSYTDENHDGTADVMRTVRGEDQVVGQARFDPADGQWVAEHPEQPPHPRPQPARPLVIETREGRQPAGPPTEDTDDDGRPDTAVLATGTGTTLVTDVDGDGGADQLVQISGTGEVTISHHTGAGHWAAVEHGRLDQGGQYRPHPAAAGPTDDATWTFDEPPGPTAQCTEPGPAHAVAARSDSDAAWR